MGNGDVRIENEEFISVVSIDLVRNLYCPISTLISALPVEFSDRGSPAEVQPGMPNLRARPLLDLSMYRDTDILEHSTNIQS